MTEIYFILILSISFFVQIFPRIKNPGKGIDLYRWLLYSQKIRENQFTIPDYVDKYIIKERFSYPHVLLYLMSFLSKRFLDKHNYLVSPFFAIVENIVLFYFTLYVTNDSSIALMASLVYALTAANIIENLFLSTRSIGQLTYFLSLIALYLYLFEDFSIVYFIVSLSILFITHRMSTQLMFFTVVFVSLITMNWLIFTSFFIAILLSLIITKGQYYYILKGHLIQIYFWYKQIQENKSKIKLSINEFVKSILSRNIFIIMALYLALSYPLNELDIAILMLFIFIFIMAILTTFIKPLRCVGEGHRYIGFTNPLVAFFIADNLNGNYYLLALFAIMSLAPALYKQYLVLYSKEDSNNSFYLTDELAKFIEDHFEKNKEKEVKFMSYPPNLDDYIAYRYDNVKVMFHDNGFALDRSYIPPFSSNKEKNEQVIQMLHNNNIDFFITPLNIDDLNGFSYIKIDNINIFYKD